MTLFCDKVHSKLDEKDKIKAIYDAKNLTDAVKYVLRKGEKYEN